MKNGDKNPKIASIGLNIHIQVVFNSVFRMKNKKIWNPKNFAIFWVAIAQILTKNTENCVLFYKKKVI